MPRSSLFRHLRTLAAHPWPRPTRDHRDRAGRHRPSRSPVVEPLEGRAVPATITVTSLADSGAGTLRAAIEEANLGLDLDTIAFDASLSGRITLLSALPDIDSNILLNGPGADALTVARSSDGTTPGFRIFTVTGRSVAQISGLTISNGVSAEGGGIRNSGTLTVAGCVVSDNRGGFGVGIRNEGALNVVSSTIRDNSGFEGAGILNVTGTLTVADSSIIGNDAATNGGGLLSFGGMLTSASPVRPAVAIITNTVFRENSAGVGGGGIASRTSAALTLIDCTLSDNSARVEGGGLSSIGLTTVTGTTFSGNTAPDGGGLHYRTGPLDFDNGPLTVVNSTFSGNSAARRGGGIYHAGRVVATNTGTTITDSTLAGNQAEDLGDGLFSTGGPLAIQATIFDNAAGGNLLATGGVTSLGHNLFSDRPFIDLQPTDLVDTDPLLAPLGEYGGPTRTHALLPGSPAIDAGVAVPGVPDDQRGILRVWGLAPDIGAFESRGFSIAAAGGDDQRAQVGSPFDAPLVVSVASRFGEPVEGGLVTFAAPPSGPSATLTGSPASIDADGRAQVVASANGEVGTYPIIARAAGSPGLILTLTNLPIPVPPPPPPPPAPPAPTVLSVQRFGVHRQPTAIVLRFSEPMDAPRAESLANYRLVWLGRDRLAGTRDDREVPLQAATYEAATQSVRLSPGPRLSVHRTYQLTVNGEPPDGLTNLSGTFLGGQGADRPGTDFVATVDRQSLVSATPHGPTGTNPGRKAARRAEAELEVPQPVPALSRRGL